MSLSVFGNVGCMMAGTLHTALHLFRRNSGTPSAKDLEAIADSLPRVSNFLAVDEAADARIAQIIRAIPQRRTRR